MKARINIPILLCAVILAAAGFKMDGHAPAEAEILMFRPDKSHSQVGFKIRHLGLSNVRGAFQEYDAVVRFDPDELTTLSVEATAEVASIDTGVERRDNHLRSDDFFNADQYPVIRFVSKAVRNVDGAEFELVGDLTIRDVTKEVVFDVEFGGVGTVRDGRKAGFEAETTINRFDYNLKWDRLTETGGLVAGENVDIILELELNEEVAELSN